MDYINYIRYIVKQRGVHMKYFVVVLDGAADYNIKEIGDSTPLTVAKKPVLDSLAKRSIAGTVSNVPEGMVPESDTANLAILSYDPKTYSKGRSPLEAVSMGIKMQPDEIAFRCNVVTVSEDEENYDDKIMLDHSADEITTEEATELIKSVQEAFGNSDRKFYPGVSYRHCLIWKNPPAYSEFMRPHDILGRKIAEYLPPEPFASLYRESYKILENHPINIKRRERGLRPANSIWLWSPGAKPALPDFNEKWGIQGAVISAVDLIKGIGLCAGMESIDVEGATGNINTNYKGKAEAAINAFKDGKDFVFVHVEAPDECGHRAELENKIKSIELIDKDIVKPVYEYLKSCGDDDKIMAPPDHPTPNCKRTHTMDPVPFMIFDSRKDYDGIDSLNEKAAKEKNFYLPCGYELLSYMVGDKRI